MLIPQGMAYALIAGLPPVYGLYAALIPVAVYALLGTSRQLAVGPVAMVALLVADGVEPISGGDPQRYIELAIVLAALVGLIQLMMGVVRAGFLVNLLSHPVLTGFTAAAAIIIGMSQLGGLTGLSIEKGAVHDMLLQAFSSWDAVSIPTIAIGVGALVAGFTLRRVAPLLPAPMLLVALGTFASWAFTLSAVGVQTVGDVPPGLPRLHLPGLGSGLGSGDILALLPIALAISLVGFMESIAVAKVYAAKNHYDLDANQELRALGIANIAGALFQAFPVTGGFSRTAVNAQARARTQVSSLVSVTVVVVTLLFLTPLVYSLPNAILSAIIVVAVAGLVDVSAAVALWKVDRRDFVLLVATFACTLAFGIEEGILVGALLSVAVVLHQISTPHIAILGRIPGTDLYRDAERHTEAVLEPGISVLRLEASLFYCNAETFRDTARSAFSDAVASAHPGQTPRLVIDAYPINRIDSTGLHVLGDLMTEVTEGGGEMQLIGAKGTLTDKLRLGGLDVSGTGEEGAFLSR
jgi:SulP family sulfate permease